MTARPCIVVKFGGTSLADPEKIARAAERAICLRREGARVVAVVSAPGEMTDDLIELARRIAPRPDSREMDMLLATGEQVGISLFAMACRARGVAAVSLTGPQAGIYADSVHARARIVNVRPQKIISELRCGRIVVVAGFQGLNPSLDVTTLGRGGSDLTAAAVAGALGARRCEIYTDVEGVYTADPRIVPEARVIARIAYDEMLELAAGGAQVMQSRSIEVAKKFRVPIWVRSSLNLRSPGTWITAEAPNMEEVLVTGVAADRNQMIITLRGVPARPGGTAGIFTLLGGIGVSVDLILQSPRRGKADDVSFTIPREEGAAALKALRGAEKRIGFASLEQEPRAAKISVVGVGMRSHPGVAGRMFDALARNAIEVRMISTSEIKICCLVGQEDADRAVRCLHAAFGLGGKRRRTR